VDCIDCFSSFLSGTSWNFSFDAIAHHGKSATKIFIRSSFEFAVRLPKIKFEEYYNTYPLNLLILFDTLMIQKERQNY
jgi:hypothetical protein